MNDEEDYADYDESDGEETKADPEQTTDDERESKSEMQITEQRLN